jgi:hypothetical protein
LINANQVSIKKAGLSKPSISNHHLVRKMNPPKPLLNSDGLGILAKHISSKKAALQNI